MQKVSVSEVNKMGIARKSDEIEDSIESRACIWDSDHACGQPDLTWGRHFTCNSKDRIAEFGLQC